MSCSTDLSEQKCLHPCYNDVCWRLRPDFCLTLRYSSGESDCIIKTFLQKDLLGFKNLKPLQMWDFVESMLGLWIVGVVCVPVVSDWICLLCVYLCVRVCVCTQHQGEESGPQQQSGVSGEAGGSSAGQTGFSGESTPTGRRQAEDSAGPGSGPHTHTSERGTQSLIVTFLRILMV